MYFKTIRYGESSSGIVHGEKEDIKHPREKNIHNPETRERKREEGEEEEMGIWHLTIVHTGTNQTLKSSFSLLGGHDPRNALDEDDSSLSLASPPILLQKTQDGRVETRDPVLGM